MKSLINANSSGQGTCPDYRSGNEALTDAIQSAGWIYSHSVFVTFPGNEKRLYHCFKLHGHNAGFYDGRAKWQTSTSCASGRMHTGTGAATLAKHLAGKVRRYRLKFQTHATP